MSQPQLRINTFGGLSISCDDRLLTGFASTKVQALLVYLAANPRPHPREMLADLLWDDRTQKQALANLRVVLSSLRKSAGDYVTITRVTAAINPESEVWLDAAVLEETLTGRWDAEEAAAALDSYQGEFLSGFFLRDASGFEAWQVWERERLHRLALDGLQKLVDCSLEQGQHEQGVGWANRMLAFEPLAETGHRQLMRLLALGGQRDQALAQYETCRRILDEELGVEPSAETEAVVAEIRSGRLAPPAKEPERQLSPHNLPVQPTRFIGREEQLEQLQAFLTDPDHQLVTILAPGGMGKTRLALAAAERLLATPDNDQRFPDGIFFVALAATEAFDDVAPAIASSMGIRDLESGADACRRQVQRILDGKRLLLILDNFEQLVATAAAWLSELLQLETGTHLLVTSRARLSLRAEQLFPLEGLSYDGTGEPVGESEAARLFLQAARRSRPDYSPEQEGDVAALGEICRLVDGHPLALELAAGWVELLPLPEITAEIRQSLEILETELADIPKRHRSIHALLDGTWARLGPAEQRILARLSIFRGGFTIRAAAAVTGASLRQLVNLSNQALLQPVSGRDRFDMHTLLRQYADSKLDASAREEALDAHCAYYCGRLDELTDDLCLALPGPMEAFEQDLRNVRRAFQHAVERADFERLGEAALGLVWFYRWSGREFDISADFKPLPERLVPLARSPKQKRVLAVLQACATWNEPNVEAIPAVRQSLTWLDEVASAGLDVRAERAFVLRRLAEEYQHVHGNNIAPALEECCRLYRKLGNQPRLAEALSWWVSLEHHMDRSENALSRALETSDIYKQAGATRLGAESLGKLGASYLQAGERTLGNAHLEKGLALTRSTGNQNWLAEYLGLYCYAMLTSGQYIKTVKVSTEANTINDLLYERSLNVNYRVRRFHSGLPAVEARMHLGQYEAVVGAILDLGQDPPGWWQPYHQAWTLTVQGLVSLAQGALVIAKERFEGAVEPLHILQSTGRESLSRSGQSLIALAEGNTTAATSYLLVYLEPVITKGNFSQWTVPFIFPAAAVWMVQQGRIERAVELWSCAYQHPMVPPSVLIYDLCGRQIEEAAATLDPEQREAAEARGRQLNREETAKALLRELSEADV